MMRKFLLWDHDGVLVDTERWYFTATKESLGRLDVQLDQPTYLRFMAKGRSCWDLAVQRGLSQSSISEAKLERDQRYQELLLKEKIEIEGVIEVLGELAATYRMAIVSTSKRADFDLIHKSKNSIILRVRDQHRRLQSRKASARAVSPRTRALRGHTG